MWNPNRSFEPGRRLFLLAAAGAAMVPAALLPMTAQSQSRPLDAPRAAGTVGERWDGYAVVRSGASADITALVERVNTERRALYTERAKAQSVPVEEIGKIYAVEIMKSAPKGTWFQAQDGSWTQK